MIDKESEIMILNFIQKTYPVCRLKKDGRFRRAIIMDDGEHIFKDDSSSKLIKSKLAKRIQVIFACSEIEAHIFIAKAISI